MLFRSEKVLRVEARSPEVVNAYRTKLEAKVSELLEDTQIDDNRIAAEVILFSAATFIVI